MAGKHVTTRRTAAEARASLLQNSAALARIKADRVAAKVCRHCGGPVPCWSEFGDYSVGVSNRAHRAKLNAKRRERRAAKKAGVQS